MNEDRQDEQPIGRNYPELLRALMASGVDITAREVMGQINANDDGTFTLWCVRVQSSGPPIYLGRVEHTFATSKEAGDQAACLPDDLYDVIEAGRSRH